MEVNATTAADAARVLKEFLRAFPPEDVKVKPAIVKGNRCLALHYIDARLVMDRLDETVGVDGWQDAYTVLPTGEVECRLSVRIAGAWVTKADVGSQSEQPDEGDRMKAAYSDALKRAAVKFGIGRFLYRLPQQWMDYDPVKKQVIRPAPTVAAPATRDNLALRAKRTAELAQCRAHADYLRVSEAITADVSAGLLSAADRDALRAAAGQTAARLKAAPATA